MDYTAVPVEAARSAIGRDEMPPNLLPQFTIDPRDNGDATDSSSFESSFHSSQEGEAIPSAAAHQADPESLLLTDAVDRPLPAVSPHGNDDDDDDVPFARLYAHDDTEHVDESDDESDDFVSSSGSDEVHDADPESASRVAARHAANRRSRLAVPRVKEIMLLASTANSVATDAANAAGAACEDFIHEFIAAAAGLSSSRRRAADEDTITITYADLVELSRTVEKFSFLAAVLTEDFGGSGLPNAGAMKQQRRR